MHTIYSWFHCMKKCQVCLSLHIAVPKKTVFHFENPKPNLLVRKSEQGQLTKKSTFLKKKTIFKLCTSVTFVTLSILLKTNPLQSKNN